MKLVDRLKQIVDLLEKKELPYALAGGLVASLYRNQPRATADIDLVILTEDDSIAVTLLKSLKLKPHLLRKANLEGDPQFAIKKNNTPVCIVCGRSDHSETEIGVDFILSLLPWVKSALERAQYYRIDFGFGPIPCLTVEDFILSKIYSYSNQSSRFMDLDDLRSIFESPIEIDWTYVRDQMKTLKLSMPKPLKPFLPQKKK